MAEGQGDARDKIARYLGVGRTTIERAEAVVEAAEEEPEEYGHLVEQMDRSGKVAGAYRRLTVLKQAKELEAAAPELPTGPFQVIVADPPWQYDSGNSLPYPTMPLEDIKAMPVREIADENAILWLWTTNAHLPVAFDVVAAWGFEYKTLLTWVKDRMGTGEWLRGQTEHCMLAARGKPVFLHGIIAPFWKRRAGSTRASPRNSMPSWRGSAPAAGWSCSPGSSARAGIPSGTTSITSSVASVEASVEREPASWVALTAARHRGSSPRS